MRIKYIGGRSVYKITLNRVSYHFTQENKKTLDIKDPNVINYIFGLPNRAEFQVVEPEEIKLNPENNTVETKQEVKEEPKKKIKSKKEGK